MRLNMLLLRFGSFAWKLEIHILHGYKAVINLWYTRFCIHFQYTSLSHEGLSLEMFDLTFRTSTFHISVCV